jgi:hypothetical protein
MLHALSFLSTLHALSSVEPAAIGFAFHRASEHYCKTPSAHL